MSGRPVQIDGEVLQPPRLNFSGNTAESPHNGVWNVMNKSLHIPKQLRQWAVIDLSTCKDGGNARTRFIRELEGCLRGLGILNSCYYRIPH